MTLGAGDTGLDDAGGGFLQFWNRPIISFKVHHPQLPREEEGSAEILHEVRLGFSTYVALVDADNQARTGSCFLGHFDGWLWVVVDGEWEEVAGEEILQPQKVLGRVRVGVVRTLGRKVDCPIVGKERPIESKSFLPCSDVPTPDFPLAGVQTLTRPTQALVPPSAYGMQTLLSEPSSHGQGVQFCALWIYVLCRDICLPVTTTLHSRA